MTAPSPSPPPSSSTPAPGVVVGLLREAKGAWVFRPDGVDVLLRVTPLPPPAAGTMQLHIEARLLVLAAAVRRAPSSSSSSLSPRTGVPTRLVGSVVGGGGETLIVDAGVVVCVDGVRGAFAPGDVVDVDVDVDAGVRCAVLGTR